MKIKKFYTAISLFILTVVILTLSGCKTDCNTGTEKTESDFDTASAFNNDDFPSFSIENAEASPGEEITVFVNLKDNPGFLTMALNIEYDSNAMSLIDAKNGPDYEEYTFVGPKNLNSGCTAGWFIPELPDNIKDGKLLELHFKILSSAEKGEYPISITRPDNGGIVDADKEILVINNDTGYVTIK